jgi:hypothetical protein
MNEHRELVSVDSLEGDVTITSADRPQVEPAEVTRTDRPPVGHLQPPGGRVGVAEAIGWHWITFAIPVVVITGLAALVGLSRTPDYTAEAKLAIGGPASLAGFAANSESLAEGYSQAMHAPGVIRRISRGAGTPPEQSGSRVTASSTVGSPLVRVQATDATSTGAIKLANAASSALIGYINRLNDDAGAGQALLKEFEDATVKINRLSARLKSLKSSGADPNTITEARAARDAAKLQARSASADYQTSQTNRASGGRLQVLSPAGQATSDRLSKLELLIFIGLAVGIAVGAALASIRANGWVWPALG